MRFKGPSVVYGYVVPAFYFKLTFSRFKQAIPEWHNILSSSWLSSAPRCVIPMLSLYLAKKISVLNNAMTWSSDLGKQLAF
jgi:hypothetical protein